VGYVLNKGHRAKISDNILMDSYAIAKTIASDLKKRIRWAMIDHRRAVLCVPGKLMSKNVRHL
jgi:hypothetical protein